MIAAPLQLHTRQRHRHWLSQCCCTLSFRTVEKTVAGRIENLKPWPRGVSGNPAGRPRHDLSAEIARAVFEQNPDLIYRAMLRALKKGNAKTFAILADRAYGKVTTSVEMKLNASISLAERLERVRKTRIERERALSVLA